MTPAKNQEGCGTSYAFAAVGAIESYIAKKTGRLLDLSEQQVVDCSYRIRTDLSFKRFYSIHMQFNSA